MSHTQEISTLNRHLAAAKPSATYHMLARIQHRREHTASVLSLCAGEPDMHTPAHIAQAAIDAIQQGKTRYSPVAGLRTLREAVAKKFTHENGIPTRWQDTLVSSGGKQIIFNALAATLNDGDEVIIPAPYWVSYPEVVHLCGGVSRIIACEPAQQFKLTPQQLTDAITSRTRWLILNSPANPTGAVYTKAELCALGEVLQAYPHVMVLCDDIYEHLVFDAHAFHTLAQCVPQLAQRVVTMNGASKGYAMTGWRIGYCTGPDWLIQAMTTLQGQQTSGACTISQYAALAALTGPQHYLATARDTYQQRRDALVTRIQSIPGLSCEQANGAFYVFVSCAGWIGKVTPYGTLLNTDEDVVNALLDEANLGVMHGSAFGLGPYLRISYATDQHTLEQACDVLATFASALK